MNKTDYTYAVARIRANELLLLTKADFDTLINAPDKNSCLRLLADRKWQISDGGNVDFEKETQKALELIRESVPDFSLLEALVAENDFANIKAAIKARFSMAEIEKYLVEPCLCPFETIISAVNSGDFLALPDYLREAAEKAYNAITSNLGGQAAEMIIDKAKLETKLKMSEKAQSGLLTKIVLAESAKANIKIALRCAKTGKSREFLLDSLCSCPGLDNEKLADTCSDSAELAGYVAATDYAFLAEGITKGFAQVERICDEYIVSAFSGFAWEIYGTDPITAYYYRKLNEIRNVRIIISAKENNLTADEIYARVRGINV